MAVTKENWNKNSENHPKNSKKENHEKTPK